MLLRVPIDSFGSHEYECRPGYQPRHETSTVLKINSSCNRFRAMLRRLPASASLLGRAAFSRAYQLPRQPASRGVPLAHVETPALLLDMDRLELNASEMGRSLAPHTKAVRLRPHAKALKSTAFVSWVLSRKDHGVQPYGVCCQTVTEVEMAANAPEVRVKDEVPNCD